MPATVNGSLSSCERQQQSLEDAWFFQLASLRLQHNIFVTTDTNTKVSNLQPQAFSMTAIQEVSLD